MKAIASSELSVEAMESLNLDIKVPFGGPIHVLLATENETCDFAGFELLVTEGSDTATSLDLLVESNGKGGATVEVSGTAPDTGATLKAMIPEKFSIAVASGGGNVSVARIEGKVSINTEGGDISMDKVSEGPATLESGGGNVEARVLNCDADIKTLGGAFKSKRMQGLDFLVKTGDGDIDVAAMYATTIKVETEAGAISIGSLHAETDLTSVSGNVSVKTGADGDLSINTSTGDVDVQLGMAIRRMESHTAQGNINISAPSKFAANPITLHGKDGVNIDGMFKKSVEYDGHTATGRIGDVAGDGSAAGGGNRG